MYKPPTYMQDSAKFYDKLLCDTNKFQICFTVEMQNLRLTRQQQSHILTGNLRAAYHWCETLLCKFRIAAPVMKNSLMLKYNTNHTYRMDTANIRVAYHPCETMRCRKKHHLFKYQGHD